MAADIEALARTASRSLPTLDYQAWHFGDSIAFEAMLAAADRLDAPDLRGFAHGFVRAWDARRDDYRETDCTAAGAAICTLALRTGDERLLTAATGLARHLTSRGRVQGVFATWEQAPLRRPYGPEPLPPDQEALLETPGRGVFVDCLHFDPPFFAALSRATGDRSWAELAVEQAEGYVRLLQNPETNLFDHFFLERTGHTYAPGWGRGQGWALLGLLDVIEQLPGAATDKLQDAARRLVLAMLRRQRPDGSWHAVAGDSRSGDESSTAAFMAVGFRRARDLGIVTGAEVDSAIATARQATIRATDDAGVLGGVSAAVWACTLLSHYYAVPTAPRTPWGQGPLVLALLDTLAHP
ncbi:glycoside hydrolase family 88 protein [uncultured Aeromicrobium sp.]|uniref:glycoside hydrolase family 88 protein n=1 Tax=uncultured Aeromicrobium sp. TaxID=337820 RepID=UPI0025EC0E71|nr:glycoside hydrolase family 88 protein [uncultured Aeromicrobium sp.]